MTEADYTSLSETLRQKRLSLKLALEEVEEKSGIKIKNLKSLESGNYHDLPATVYVQGYLKSLAKLYGLEFAKILERYKEEQNILSYQIDAAALQPRAVGSNRISLTPKTIVTGAIALTLLLVTVYMTKQISQVTAAPKVVLEEPTEGLQTTDSFIDITGTAEPGAQLTINNQAVPLNPDGKFKQTVYLNLGENQIIVRASNRFGNFSEIKRRIVVGEPIPVFNQSASEVLGEQTEVQKQGE